MPREIVPGDEKDRTGCHTRMNCSNMKLYNGFYKIDPFPNTKGQPQFPHSDG